MAEIVAGFLGPALEVVKLVAAPITRQFIYLCCFTTNINSLKHEAKKLDDEVGGLQGRVDRAKDNVQVIVPEVETWLTNCNHIKNQINTILDQVPNVESGCLKVRARFSLSKKAKKTTDRMKKLRDKCKFDVISQAGPPVARETVPLGKTLEFESRKQIELDMMTTLRGENVRMIGICGMGGLGKTTMANKIKNRVLEEQVFQEAVIAVVSQQVDESKIQVEIAGQLGLNLQGEPSKVARATKLHARLSGGAKRILVVLDDVWEGVELEGLGIPCDTKGCTILLTSRNSDVLSVMGCSVENIFGMDVLSKEDAWILFRERAGACVNDTKLKSIAEEVVKECSGLPIALATVGSALKDEKNERIWKDALQQLRQFDPDIQNFIPKVYKPLRLSYNFLSSKPAKSVFLLCCLFPEDANIDVEQLSWMCMGLGMLEGIRNLEGARNRMSALIKMLKSRSLLLDGYNEDGVRMHDVVRDVCIFIAKEEGVIGGNDCSWISSSQRELPTRLGFPNLRLLFLSRNYGSVEEEFKIDSAFLEGIRDLYVLYIENYPSLTSLPHRTQSLKNLNTLFLYACAGLKTIFAVGELVNLEILICCSCGSIEELPPEIKGLNRLKLLDLTGCKQLQRIGRGIISSLVGLEELKMTNSFKKWEAEDGEEKQNAGLRELEALTNLRCLEIDIEDPALATQNMHLSSKMDRFNIRIHQDSSFRGRFNKKMILRLEGETCLGNWIEMQLLRDTEYLSLSGNGANNVDLAKCQNIMFLEMSDCETMKSIVTTSYGGDGATVFPFIEHLKLFSLPELQEICDGLISSTSFHNFKELELTDLAALKQLWKSSDVLLFTNLSEIYIQNCPRLRNLGPLSIAGKDCLPQLKVLYIIECEMMEHVFLWNKEDQNKNNSESPNRPIKFPELNKVELCNLPNLATFYQGIEAIEFPLLEEMKIEECPKMTMIGSNQNWGGRSSADIHNDLSRLFSQPEKVSFGNLKELEIDRKPFCGHEIPLSLFNGLEELRISESCGSMMSLFTASMAENLVSLRVLKIKKCDEMVKVIEDEEEKVVSDGQRTLLFPKLEELRLYYLSKLVSFCEWKCDVELPSLRIVYIYECPSMKHFSLGPLTTPNLKTVKIDYEDIGATEDLNSTLQQQYLVRMKEEERRRRREGGGEEGRW